MRKSSVKLNIGPISIGLPAFISGIIAIFAAVIGFIILRPNKAVEELSPSSNSIGVYSISEIIGGNYYIKDNDAYYLPAPGLLYSSLQNDTKIAKKADPEHRIAMFGNDEVQIPTMYSDSFLIYKAQENENVPETVTLERYRDEGYSLGIRGLSMVNNKCQTTTTGVTFYPQSSISTIHPDQGATLTIDKVNGLTIDENRLSVSGTITGLELGESYNVDAYIGTNYAGGNFVADTHMFSSMELYTIENYSMDPSNYVILDFPKDLWSGYYYIDGVGMIKYINHPKSNGSEVDTYNQEYYVTDEHGNIVTNPATIEKSVDNTVDSPSVWNYRFPVEEGKPYLSAIINYSGESSNLTATLYSPDGRKYPLENSAESQKLFTTLESPVAGAWTITINGAKDTVFDVNLSYTDGTENAPVSTVIKNTDEPVQAMIVLGKGLNDASVTFRWENSEYAGTFELEGPDGKKYGNVIDPSSITKEIYGEVKIHTGAMPSGQYLFKATGKALGHIYITYEDAQPEDGNKEEISAEFFETIGNSTIIEESESDSDTSTEETKSISEN